MTPETIAAYQKPFGAAPARRALLKNLTDLRPRELRKIAEKLPGLKVPAHIVFGEDDVWFASETRRIHQSLPGASLAALPRCGHFLQEDQPEKVSALLMDFLSG